MAHVDYDCCAICDRKIKYSGSRTATTKDRICDDCLLALQKEDLKIVTVGQLCEWIKTTEISELRATLKRLGFNFCVYMADVDSLVRERGIKEDEWEK